MATQAEIAEHCDLSQPEVSAKIKKYGLPSRGCGIDEFRIAYIRDLRKAKSGHGSDYDQDYDLVEERARLAHHQANKTALEEAEKSGELVPAEKVLEMWIKQIAACRAKVLSIPNKLAPVAAIEAEAHTIEELLTDSLHEALAELTETGFIEDES